MDAVTKKDVVDRLASQSGMSKADSLTALNGVITVLGDALRNGEKVLLHGLGTFETKESAARNGRNPRTGESIKIPAKKQVKFKVASDLKASL